MYCALYFSKCSCHSLSDISKYVHVLQEPSGQKASGSQERMPETVEGLGLMHLLWLQYARNCIYIYVRMCFVGYICVCGLLCVSQIPNNIRKARNDPEHRKVLEDFWKVRVFGCVLYIHVCVCILTWL